MKSIIPRFLEIDGSLYNIDHIVSVKPIVEDGKVIGHRFKMTDGWMFTTDWSWEGVQDSLEGHIIHDDEE